MSRLLRFTKTERALHWLVALAFGVMLVSGGQVPHRWSWTSAALDVHAGAALVLVLGIAVLVAFGNRGALRATVADLRRLDGSDRAWLAPGRILLRRPAPPARRFNAGQKLNARLALVGMVGLYATGAWLVTAGHSALGQLHGPFAFVTCMLVAGHIFMAVFNPSTRHALRGMTLGTVERDWATHHFPLWVEDVDADGRRPEPPPDQQTPPDGAPL